VSEPNRDQCGGPLLESEGYRGIVGGSDGSADLVGKTLVGLAREFAAKGRHKQAENVLADLWNIQRNVLGNVNTHGTTAALGEAYRNLGPYAKAEEILTGLWNAQRELLGEAHPRTLQTMNQLVPPGTGTGISGPRVRNVISHLGWALFHQQKYREAEAVLRVDVPFYDRRARPETEVRCNWEGVLGAVLVAQSKNYEEAEYRLQSCYKGRLHPIGIGIPAGDVNLFTEQESIAWLIRLYDQWGKPDRATEWRAKLQTDKPAQSSKRSEASERFQ